MDRNFGDLCEGQDYGLRPLGESRVLKLLENARVGAGLMIMMSQVVVEKIRGDHPEADQADPITPKIATELTARSLDH